MLILSTFCRVLSSTPTTKFIALAPAFFLPVRLVFAFEIAKTGNHQPKPSLQREHGGESSGAIPIAMTSRVVQMSYFPL